MQHDESWLHAYAERESHKTRVTDKIYVTVQDSVITCKAYHEHMTEKKTRPCLDCDGELNPVAGVVLACTKCQFVLASG